MQLNSPISNSKPSVHDWRLLAQMLGLEPGRQVGSGKVSITCPACGRRPERGNYSQTVLFLDSGGFCCHRGDCKGTGHLLKWARDNGRLGHEASHEASPIFALSGGHELDGHHLISRLVDLPSAYQGFENLKPSQRSYIERWARKRGCPSAVAWALARLPDVHHCPQTIPGQRQEARHARAMAQRAQGRPLLFWMRDEEGRLVWSKRRGQAIG